MGTKHSNNMNQCEPYPFKPPHSARTNISGIYSFIFVMISQSIRLWSWALTKRVGFNHCPWSEDGSTLDSCFLASLIHFLLMFLPGWVLDTLAFVLTFQLQWHRQGQEMNEMLSSFFQVLLDSTAFCILHVLWFKGKEKMKRKQNKYW